MADSQVLEQSQERERVLEQCATGVKSAIHVQRSMANLAQTSVQSVRLESTEEYKKTGSLASEFQFLRDCLRFIHQTRMYYEEFYPRASWVTIR